MPPITLALCLKGAWRDTWRSITTMRRLSFLLLLATLAASWSTDVLHIGFSSGAHSNLSSHDALVHAIASVAVLMALSVVGAFFAIRVINFSLAGHHNTTPRGALLSYLWLIGIWCVIGISIIFLLCAGLVGLTYLLRHAGASVRSSAIALFFLLAVATAIASIGSLIYTRLCILFPHVAWADTRGQSWVLTGINSLCTLPALVLSTIFSMLRFHLATAGSIYGWSYTLTALISSILAVIYATNSATCAAWIYRRCSKNLMLNT